MGGGVLSKGLWEGCPCRGSRFRKGPLSASATKKGRGLFLCFPFPKKRAARKKFSGRNEHYAGTVRCEFWGWEDFLFNGERVPKKRDFRKRRTQPGPELCDRWGDREPNKHGVLRKRESIPGLSTEKTVFVWRRRNSARRGGVSKHRKGPSIQKEPFSGVI